MTSARRRRTSSVKEQRRRRNQSKIALANIPTECGKPILVIDPTTIKHADAPEVIGNVSTLLDS